MRIRIRLAIVLVGLSAVPSAAQDWRTSGEDPCLCSDSMPFIIGPRAPVTTAEEVAAVVADARSQSCRVARLAIESLRNGRARVGS